MDAVAPTGAAVAASLTESVLLLASPHRLMSAQEASSSGEQRTPSHGGTEAAVEAALTEATHRLLRSNEAFLQKMRQFKSAAEAETTHWWPG